MCVLMGFCFEEELCLLVSQEWQENEEKEAWCCLGRFGVTFFYVALPNDCSQERGKCAERKRTQIPHQ